MFLRATTRKKDGKEHRYFSVVENRRDAGGRVLPRRGAGGGFAGEPQGHALGSGAVRAGGLSSDRTRQRVAVAPGVVWAHRARRSVGGGRGPRRQPWAVRPS